MPSLNLITQLKTKKRKGNILNYLKPFLNFESIYSQVPKILDSSNCEDNENQLQYLNGVTLENKSNTFDPAIKDLLDFHHVKKFDSYNVR